MRSVAMCVLAASIATPALAQGTVTFSNSVAHASMLIGSPTGTFGPTGTSTEALGNDFRFVQDRRIQSGPVTGAGYAELAATFTPSGPLGLGRVFSSVQLEACTSAEIFTSAVAPSLGANVFETARGSALGMFEFTIPAPTAWTWNGVAQGNTFNTGSYHSVSAAFGLREVNTLTPYVSLSNTSTNGVGDFFIPFSFGGVLPAGTYEITWSHETIQTGGSTPFGQFPTSVGGAPLFSCIPSVFTLVPSPSTTLLIGGAGLATACRRRRHAPCIPALSRG